jgi:hypothetical protein
MSLALNRLSPEERKVIREKLWARQNGFCFITRKPIDLDRDDVEIDHVIPTRDKGPDDESNWAIVFARANASKQASHLYVARILYRLEEIRKKANDPRGANLGHVLANYGGGRYPLKASISESDIHFKLSEVGQFDAVSAPIKNKAPGDEQFSERDLVEHYRGEQAQMRRYILDAQRNAISHHEDNKLRDFIEWGGKGGDKPISYSSVEKTFFSQFIGKEMLDTPFQGVTAQGENPRELERRQIVKLMTLIADAYFSEGKYDFTRGTDKLENKVLKGEHIPDSHLRAYRIAREEVMNAWLPFVSTVIQNYFQNNGKNVRAERLFQYQFPDQLWTNIANFLAHLGRLPLWIDYQQSLTAFGGKSNAAFWEHIFDTGNMPNGAPIIHCGGLNVLEMIKPL